MDTNRDSAHQSRNEDNFATFFLGLEFLNEAEKEKNNGKGDSASAPSRFASLSEGKMQQSLLILLSVFPVGFDAQLHRLCYKTIGSCFSVHYRVMEHVGSLESTQEARVALGYRLGQLLHFFPALETSRMLHLTIRL